MGDSIDKELTALAEAIDSQCEGDGAQSTPLPGLSLARVTTPSHPLQTTYDAAVCVIAQGRKQAMLGDQRFEYGAGNYLLVSIDVPVTGQIVEASAKKPYLSLLLELDSDILGELILQAGSEAERAEQLHPSLAVANASPQLLDAATRLVRLLQTPEDLAALGKPTKQEIFYWLLKGRCGAQLRQISQSESKLQQVNRAVTWLKQHFRERVHADDLADIASMSASALYKHFRIITNMTPLQYQKQLRLQEARRLMLFDALDAGSASHAVGYESPSQFSREYSRLFGAPPMKDLARLREAPAELRYV
ncbi:AraC family transcriptional regulator [Microbulbifer hainanensis]|uniref:AraC family transcriptional regulator n=1 Tax=Microbulbifer hainanensis TaxID=2735675 RepID=UPI001D0335C4|nr:AraC family transcriptional regulator [Microbulbifer hainanensis]